MVVGVDKAGIAPQVRAVDHLVRGVGQRRAEGADHAALAVEIHALEHAVTVVAGDGGGKILDEQRGHRTSSFPISDGLFSHSSRCGGKSNLQPDKICDRLKEIFQQRERYIP